MLIYSHPLTVPALSPLLWPRMSPSRSSLIAIASAAFVLAAALAFDGVVVDITSVGAGVLRDGNGNNYNNPYKMPCGPGEYNLTVQSIPGAFCSPTCSVTSPCPTTLPPQMVASPECVLQDAYGMHLCALVCSPDNSAKVCGARATCKPVQSTGICTYDP